MLVGGDEPVFTAPVARFCDEMQRVLRRQRIAAPPHPYVTHSNDARTATAEIDAAELRACLRANATDTNVAEMLVQQYRQQRDKLLSYAAERETASQRRLWFDLGNAEQPVTPKAPAVSVPEGLPAEFADYFAGAIAWHTGDTNGARAAWSALLERPVEERRNRSTWAAFMLARSYESENAAKAITYYALVRAMQAEGLRDSLGLAAASVGWQARAHLRQQEFEQAIDRYLAQLAAGDSTAYQSLRIVARKALDAKTPLPALARHAPSRAVITAHVISTEWNSWQTDGDKSRVTLWLDAIERANITDMESAERLALAAYQLGRFDLAQRWVKRSSRAPVSQWIQSKLLLRAGKVNDAASILASLRHAFPLAEATNSTHEALADNIYVPASEDQWTPGQQVAGELGVLRLQRREYTQALDALLRAGLWADAAYVAERVLTLEELKQYVDWNWPADAQGTPDDGLPPHLAISKLAEDIRYLLARRLTRSDRTTEARDYFPEERLSAFDQLVFHLASAQNVSLPNEQRATNFYHAAWLVRTNGLELMGTELEPDFAIWGGDFQAGPTVAERASISTQAVVRASSDELRRGRAHEVDPPMRWHYRGHAAALAFEAAQLVPDNKDETAQALYWAGRWVQDLSTSDRFYKMLVRRCRRTALGKAADEWRWFPRLDLHGNPLPSPRLNRQPILNTEVGEHVQVASQESAEDSAEPTP